MENDLARIASHAGRHASELRYRAEDPIYEAWLGGALSTPDKRDREFFSLDFRSVGSSGSRGRF